MNRDPPICRMCGEPMRWALTEERKPTYRRALCDCGWERIRRRATPTIIYWQWRKRRR